MLNFNEEIEKFTPSKEIDKAEENMLDGMNPDIAEILDSLINEQRERKRSNE